MEINSNKTGRMQNGIDSSDFDRTKIYEQLEYDREPIGYTGKLPWLIQQQIGATNGIHYLDRIGKLKDYPVYDLPLPVVNKGLMLDIGNGWGRWLVAGANKGYIPIGIDIRLEFCKTAIQTLHNNNKNGYSVVADLKNLPFQDNIFDLVWSFSVIQHTHKQRLLSCLAHIDRILATGGFAFLEFPNKNGIRNRISNVKAALPDADNYDSWCVRYYTIKEYKKIFNELFTNFEYHNHSFLGIGILPEDLKYVSFKNKIISSVSLLGSFMTKIIPGLKQLSDSIYIKSYKHPGSANEITDRDRLKLFHEAHNINPTDNLNIRFLLRCPVTGDSLELSADRAKLFSKRAGFAYPVIDEIPIMIESERQPI